jgi:hypothetical protein
LNSTEELVEILHNSFTAVFSRLKKDEIENQFVPMRDNQPSYSSDHNSVQVTRGGKMLPVFFFFEGVVNETNDGSIDTTMLWYPPMMMDNGQ